MSQVFNLPTAALEQRSADYKSAVRRIKNLRYGKQKPSVSLAELAGSTLLDEHRSIVK